MDAFIKILIWAGSIIGSIFIGAVIMLLGYFGLNYLKDKRQFKHIPKDPVGLNNFIKYNKENYKLPPKVEYNKQEVEEIDRRKYEEYRTFEKLRRLAEGVSGEGSDSSLPRSNGDVPKGELLQDTAHTIPPRTNQEPTKPKGILRFD